MTKRPTIPSASSSLKRSDSIRSLMSGIATRSSANLIRPWKSNWITAPVHRPPINSTAR
jgi:hypothetical protein